MISMQVIFFFAAAFLSEAVHSVKPRNLMLRNQGTGSTKKRRLEGTHLSCLDAGEVEGFSMSLMGSELLHNNLGGLGPVTEEGNEVIHYANVGQYDGKTLDLVVSLAEDSPPYKSHKVSRNGYRCEQDVNAACDTGYFAKITQKAGYYTLMNMTIIDHDTQKQVKVPALKFSVFDIDEKSEREETIAVTGYEYAMYYDGEDAEAGFVENEIGTIDFCNSAIANGENCLVAKSTHRATNAACDNPWDPNLVGVVTCDGEEVDQLKRSFQVDFLDTSTFLFYFEVSGNNVEKGRGIQFTLGTTEWDNQCDDPVSPIDDFLCAEIV